MDQPVRVLGRGERPDVIDRPFLINTLAGTQPFGDVADDAGVADAAFAIDRGQKGAELGVGSRPSASTTPTSGPTRSKSIRETPT